MTNINAVDIETVPAIDAVQIIHGVVDVLEADPAGNADQHRDTPFVDEGEPWL